MQLKYITFDNKGRVMVARLGDGFKMAVTAFNLNTRTIQVCGRATTYPELCSWIGEDAAKEVVDYLVLDIYSYGER